MDRGVGAAGPGLAVSTLVGPLYGRDQLTLGTYTMTDQRILVESAAAGHRPTGQPISPLVLEGIPEPERVLGLIEQAQREARQ